MRSIRNHDVRECSSSSQSIEVCETGGSVENYEEHDEVLSSYLTYRLAQPGTADEEAFKLASEEDFKDEADFSYSKSRLTGPEKSTLTTIAPLRFLSEPLEGTNTTAERDQLASVEERIKSTTAKSRALREITNPIITSPFADFRGAEELAEPIF